MYFLYNYLYNALKITEEDNISLIEELWEYFYDKYLHPEVYYENLNVDDGSMLFINIIVFGLCVGIVIAAFAAVFNKRVLGGIVRKIIAAEAYSPESAKTLEELGLEGSAVARYAVRKSTTLRRVVKCREEQEHLAAEEQKRAEYCRAHEKDRRARRFRETEYKINPYADVFYIPEEMKYMADVKFEKKGSTWVGAIVSIPVMLVIFVLIVIALPNILSLVDELAGATNTPSSKYL